VLVYEFSWNSPLSHFDPYGLLSPRERWWLAGKALVQIASGGIEAAAGISVGGGGTAASGGWAAPVAIPVGIVLAADGGIRIGLGIDNIIAAIAPGLMDPVPGSFISSVGRAVDGERGERVGDYVDLIVGFPAGRVAGRYLVSEIKVVSDVSYGLSGAIVIGESGYDLLPVGGGPPRISPAPVAPPPLPTPGTGTSPLVPSAKVTLRYLTVLKCPDGFNCRGVSSRDSLWRVWRRRSDRAITWSQMLDANRHLEDPSVLKIGMPICVPACKR